ncbi:MAG: hypothetical protein ACOYJ2_02180 [Rickettsiales bacterium]
MTEDKKWFDEVIAKVRDTISIITESENVVERPYIKYAALGATAASYPVMEALHKIEASQSEILDKLDTLQRGK